MMNNFKDVNLIPKINALAALLGVQPVPNYLEINTAYDLPNEFKEFNKFKEFKSILVVTLMKIFNTYDSALKNPEDYFDIMTLKSAALELGFFPIRQDDVILFLCHL